MEHRARLRLRADEEGRVTETALPGNLIHVSEQALSLVKYGNAYGILDLTLVVHIHADAEG